MAMWEIIGAVVAVVLVVTVGYSFVHETPKKLYRKAACYHRDGAEAYEEGDVEVAEAYYTKANDYRKRAKELE